MKIEFTKEEKEKALNWIEQLIPEVLSEAGAFCDIVIREYKSADFIEKGELPNYILNNTNNICIEKFKGDVFQSTQCSIFKKINVDKFYMQGLKFKSLNKLVDELTLNTPVKFLLPFSINNIESKKLDKYVYIAEIYYQYIAELRELIFEDRIEDVDKKYILDNLNEIKYINHKIIFTFRDKTEKYVKISKGMSTKQDKLVKYLFENKYGIDADDFSEITKKDKNSSLRSAIKNINDKMYDKLKISNFIDGGTGDAVINKEYIKFINY